MSRSIILLCLVKTISGVFQGIVTHAFCAINETVGLSHNEASSVCDISKRLPSTIRNEVFHINKYIYDGDLFSLKNQPHILIPRLTLDRENRTLCPMREKCELQVLLSSINPLRNNRIYVKVAVIDVNDNRPVFDPPGKIIHISENSEPGDLGIKMTEAVDIDGNGNSVNQTSYVLGDVSRTFTVNPSTMELQLKRALDYEQQTRYSLTFYVGDTGRPSLTGSQNLSILIKNENDNSPIFTKSTYTFTIAENLTAGSLVGTLEAADMDGDHMYYIIKNPAKGKGLPFSVNQTTGDLYLVNRLLGSSRKYTFLVEARDRWTDYNSVTTSVIVNVVDLNNHSPVIVHYPVRFVENSLPPAPLTDFQATDKDEGPNGAVSCNASAQGFSLTLYNPWGGFYSVAINDTVDREQLQGNGTIVVEVMCVDMGSPVLSNSAQLFVIVEDINEFLPSFKNSKYDFSINENAPPSTEIGSVQATDLDADEKLSYAIYGDERSRHFSIDTSGTISALKVFDRENPNEQEFHFNVTCSDGSFSDTTSVTVVVTDVNDMIPRLDSSPTIFRLNEDVKLPITLDHIRVHDGDEGQNGEVEIRLSTYFNSNAETSFRVIGPNNSLVISGSLDYEYCAFYSLPVVISDRGSPPKSTTSRIMVHVVDINDNAPEWIKEGEVEFNISTSYRSDQYIGTVAAVDRDSAKITNLTYYLLAGDAAMWFLHPISAALHLRDEPRTGRFTLLIQVSDNGVPKLTAVNPQVVVVNVYHSVGLTEYMPTTTLNMGMVTAMICITVTIAFILVLATVLLRINCCRALFVRTRNNFDDSMEKNDEIVSIRISDISDNYPPLEGNGHFSALPNGNGTHLQLGFSSQQRHVVPSDKNGTSSLQSVTSFSRPDPSEYRCLLHRNLSQNSADSKSVDLESYSVLPHYTRGFHAPTLRGNKVAKRGADISTSDTATVRRLESSHV